MANGSKGRSSYACINAKAPNRLNYQARHAYNSAVSGLTDPAQIELSQALQWIALQTLDAKNRAFCWRNIGDVLQGGLLVSGSWFFRIQAVRAGHMHLNRRMMHCLLTYLLCV